MFKPIRRFFTGWRRVCVSNESSAKVFDSLYRKGISFDGEKGYPTALSLTLVSGNTRRCANALNVARYRRFTDCRMSQDSYLHALW